VASHIHYVRKWNIFLGKKPMVEPRLEDWRFNARDNLKINFEVYNRNYINSTNIS
tara:strand:+ start:508 stop:672 length:165 start_codon:yes stop_codon:yes gene_type:complete